MIDLLTTVADLTEDVLRHFIEMSDPRIEMIVDQFEDDLIPGLLLLIIGVEVCLPCQDEVCLLLEVEVQLEERMLVELVMEIVAAMLMMMT